MGIARGKILVEGGRLRERWKLLNGNCINEQTSKRGMLKGKNDKMEVYSGKKGVAEGWKLLEGREVKEVGNFY
jgi:hypothetical protein